MSEGSTLDVRAEHFDVDVLTPTRDRPDAFSLCVLWMMRQTFTGRVQWIIIDDGDVPVNHVLLNMLPSNWTITYVRRSPSTLACTLHDNLLAALPHIWSDKIVFAEDDEHYSRNYLQKMCEMLADKDLVGEKNAHYYNVACRRWWMPDNQKHSSLCRTGLRKEVLPLLETVCRESKEAGDVFIDMRLWKRATDSALAPMAFEGGGPMRTLLVPWSGLSVGIKGMPGRSGLGRSHARDAFPHGDPQLKKLREWIGTDAYRYAGFYDIKKPVNR